ncbi:MAG: hypothetical protein PHC49_10755 [Desulfuromonadaceae bacterium]|nr:hypothetical protein [Desulfuromonadaceae bacterium]
MTEKELVRLAHANNKPEATTMAELTQDEIIGYLNTLPSSDVDFKNALKQADEHTVRMILDDTPDLPANKKIKAALEARLQQILAIAVETNDHHDGILKMDVATYEAGRDDELQRDMDQCNREKRIAEAHEIIGRVQALSFIEKVTTISSLVQLSKIKESKVYRDLPNIGTWEKYCDYIGLTRQKVDEDLRNLATFGEQFLTTCQQFSLGYRDMRKLKQLTHEGSVIIDGDCLVIADESPIPIDQDHAEELQAAIERIITDRAEMNKRLTRLEKDFRGAVKEETLGFHSKEKAFVERILELEKYEPANMDDSHFEEQYQTIHDTINTLACQIGKLVMIEGLHENPLVAAKVEGNIASAERLVEDLRRDWSAKFQIF